MRLWGMTLFVGVVVQGVGLMLLLLSGEDARAFLFVVVGIGGAVTFVGLVAAGVWLGTQHLHEWRGS